MIQSLKINDFRCFKNINIKLGKNLTAISGKNGIGKSTILAILGNSCELGKEKTILGNKFRTEFSEIFKADQEFDSSGSNKCEINFTSIEKPNEITETKHCRVTWQKKGKNTSERRFRLVPETLGEDHNSRKMQFPSLYLGLSRLYPIGESNSDKLSIKGINLSNEEETYFIDNYTNILSLSLENDINIDFIDININRKKGVGINTSNYSSLTNSAGQDNIGQILLAILSFDRLKNKQGDSYKGGLLLIDELDATLHPRAQVKLIDYLYKESKRLELQIIFTTHSTTILEKIYKKNLSKDLSDINDLEIVYITKHNGPIEIKQNPSFSTIYNDLNISKPGEIVNKIPVYLEDDEAKWLFDKLTNELNLNYNSISMQLGCDTLLKLNTRDPYFSNIIFMLDGDVKDSDIEKNNKFKNIVKLPGGFGPEEAIYNFFDNLDSDNILWESASQYGINKESLREHGPMSSKYDGQKDKRDKYKKWFNEYKEYFESLDLVYHWKINNFDEYIEFHNNFVHTYNTIATRNLIPNISDSFTENIVSKYNILNPMAN